jgi:hypothetical protein
MHDLRLPLEAHPSHSPRQEPATILKAESQFRMQTRKFIDKRLDDESISKQLKLPHIKVIPTKDMKGYATRRLRRAEIMRHNPSYDSLGEILVEPLVKMLDGVS